MRLSDLPVSDNVAMTWREVFNSLWQLAWETGFASSAFIFLCALLLALRLTRREKQ